MIDRPAHAQYGPSSSSVWFSCPASIQMIARMNLPNENTPEAMEGTAVHTLIEHCLTHNMNAKEHLNAVINVDPEDGQRVVPFTMDEHRCGSAQIAIDYFRLILAQPGDAFSEVHCDLTYIDPDFYGTADMVHVGYDGIMSVVDYKNGRVGVNVENNTQLMIYAVGAYRGVAKVAPHIQWIRLAIIQPNAIDGIKPVRDIVISIADLIAFEAQLPGRIAATKAQNPLLAAGKQCTHCDARSACSKFKEDMVSTAHAITGTDLLTASTDRLSEIFSQKKSFEVAFKLVEAELQKRLISGQKSVKHKLVTKTVYDKWIDEDKAMAYLFSKHEAKALRPITPGQAKKLGRDDILLTYMSKGSPVPVIDSVDSRKAPFVIKTTEDIMKALQNV